MTRPRRTCWPGGWRWTWADAMPPSVISSRRPGTAGAARRCHGPAGGSARRCGPRQRATRGGFSPPAVAGSRCWTSTGSPSAPRNCGRRRPRTAPNWPCSRSGTHCASTGRGYARLERTLAVHRARGPPGTARGQRRAQCRADRVPQGDAASWRRHGAWAGPTPGCSGNSSGWRGSCAPARCGPLAARARAPHGQRRRSARTSSARPRWPRSSMLTACCMCWCAGRDGSGSSPRAAPPMPSAPPISRGSRCVAWRRTDQATTRAARRRCWLQPGRGSKTHCSARPPGSLATVPVIVVPPGKLHAIPWALLPVLRDRVVSVAPSASAWMRAHAAAPPARHHVTLARGPGLITGGAEVPLVAKLYDDVTVLADSEPPPSRCCARWRGPGWPISRRTGRSGPTARCSPRCACTTGR